MKIAVFETEEWEHAACVRLQPGHEIACYGEPLDERTASRAEDADAVTTFVGSRLDADVLGRLPRLRLIATRSTGFDHIDLGYCAAHAITVCNVPDYGDNTVAEHAFALLLSLARHVVDCAERTRRGDFSHAGTRGFDLNGKMFGVIGTGRIGRCAIRIAKGFGMTVLAHDLNPDREHADLGGFRYGSLQEVLNQSDVLSLHVPATPETRHLLSDDAFHAVKPGVVLINTSRGSVIDVAALVRALADGRVGAAGLDVLPEEPLIREEAEIFRKPAAAAPDYRTLVANHVLLRFPNVVVTPHIAFNTREPLQRILDTTLGNILAFAAGRPGTSYGRRRRWRERCGGVICRPRGLWMQRVDLRQCASRAGRQHVGMRLLRCQKHLRRIACAALLALLWSQAIIAQHPCTQENLAAPPMAENCARSQPAHPNRESAMRRSC